MSAEFVAEEGTLKGLILTLEKGESWTVGRDPDLCAIVIEDPKVSRKHVLIRKTEEGFVVENLSESNPAQYKGHPLSEPVLLHAGDTLAIGGTIFRFYPEGAITEGEAFEFAHEPSFFEETLEEEPFEEEGEEALKEEETIKEEEEAPIPVEEEPEEVEQPTIFEEAEEIELPEVNIDLTPTTRFLLKVIAGPNTGAEFALDLEREYLIGTDATTCDIIFNDLSVSREHAKLKVSAEGTVSIADLDSRNGVVVDQEKVKKKQLIANAIVSLGTSTFLLIDREAPAETIAAPMFEAPGGEEKVEVPSTPVPALEPAAAVAVPKKHIMPAGTLILSLVVLGLAILFGIGMVSLFKSEKIETVRRDYLAEIEDIVKQFSAVRFTYNPSSGVLFLMGHVQTGVEKNELLYKLRGLSFLTGLEDNVVNDEAVWQEMNILLSKHPDFKGISMHAPAAGEFVLSGYLNSEKQAADLVDYMNVNFNYLNRLKNQVVVEQQVVEEVTSRLLQAGMGAVVVHFTNGELQMTGYVSTTQMSAFENLLHVFGAIPGVRSIRNFVVSVSPEQGVIDLSQRYPGRYRVTGYSKHGDININVVINGKILTRGDRLDGMIVTSIQPHTIFLEKDGLKYKIEYNE